MSSRLPEAILLDANLMVLLVVGRVSRAEIARHKCLRAYSAKNYDLLAGIVSNASRLVICPNVVTEASNLVRQTHDALARRCSEALAAIVRLADERYVDSKTAVERAEYARLGVTDAVLLTLLIEGPTLFTADLDLFLAAQWAGFPAQNFNHLLDR